MPVCLHIAQSLCIIPDILFTFDKILVSKLLKKWHSGQEIKKNGTIIKKLKKVQEIKKNDTIVKKLIWLEKIVQKFNLWVKISYPKW